MPLSEAQVQSVLRSLVDPNTGKDFITTRSVRNLKVSDDAVSLDIELGYPGKSQQEPIRRQVVQLLKDTRWRELDFLVVDLPPGTGDIQLTLAQKVPVTGAVIVTTPQDIALIDARKGLKMFEKVGIPILGVVENMSFHVCPSCGHRSHIFGAGGAERMCREYGTELLGQLPLDEAIRVQADSGKPTVVADPDGASAEIYRRIARRCAVKVAELQRDMSSKFPNIVVQNT